MSASNNMLELSDQIFRPIIIYIPKIAVDGLNERHVKVLRKFKVSENLILIDFNGEPHLFEDSMNQMQLLKKEKALKSNILKLIQFKTTNHIETFQFQFEDYLKDVETWVKATEYIKYNAKTETHNYFDEIQPYLDLQYNVLKQHHIELKQRFAEIKTESIVEHVISSTQTNLGASQATTTQAADIVKLPKKEKGKKKTEFPDDEIIDKFLLETVFGLDFSKISTENKRK